MPAVVAAFLLALAIAILPNGSARAADECVAAPNSQAPQGSHWYYRIDHENQRKCWYARPEGVKVRNAEAQGRHAERLLAPSGAATDGLIPPTLVGQPRPAIPPASSGSVSTQGSIETIPFTVSRPGPPQRAGTVEQQGAAMKAPAAQDHTLQGRTLTKTRAAHDEAQVRQPVTATTEMAASTTVPLSSMLLIFAGALVTVGILHFTISNMFAARHTEKWANNSPTRNQVWQIWATHRPRADWRPTDNARDV